MRYKRVARGAAFSVHYPARLWNELSPEEQLEIARFYKSTYGKRRKAATQASQNERRPGVVNGRNPSSPA